MRRYLFALLGIASLLCLVAASGPDPVQQGLDQAKNDYGVAVSKANNDLTDAFDRQIASVSKAGDLDAAEVLRSQKKAFLESQRVPEAPSMQPAAADYKESLISADASLSAAYDTAISSYTKAQHFDDAERVKRMKAERFAPAAAASGQGAPATQPADPILDALQASKDKFRKEIGDAHAEVLSVINSRAQAAADRGDLDGYKYFSGLYATVRGGIVVPDDVKDTQIQNANAKFLRIASDAYSKLRRSYDDAIRSYTQARRIREAEAIQAELADGGWFAAYTGQSNAPAADGFAEVRFDEQMGYTVGTLAKGARTHNNDVVTYEQIPEALIGKAYTLVVARAKGHVRVHFLTSGKLYVLASSWMPADQVAGLATLAHREEGMAAITSSGAESWTVWSIAAKAGADVDLPFPVPIVAESLTKISPRS